MYVAQILPDEEQAVVILEALSEYIGARNYNYSDPKVLAAEGIKAKLITDMRRTK